MNITIRLNDATKQVLTLEQAITLRAETKAQIKELESECEEYDAAVLEALGVSREVLKKLKAAKDLSDQEVTDLKEAAGKLEEAGYRVQLTAYLRESYSKTALLEAGVTMAQIKAATSKSLVAYPNVAKIKE